MAVIRSLRPFGLLSPLRPHRSPRPFRRQSERPEGTPHRNREVEWRDLVVAVAFCELVGVVPGYLTADGVQTWYQTLEKPDRNPPDWVFGPVWGILFAAMGVSLYLIRRERQDATGRRAATGLFLLQLALNATWTLVFFGRRSILGGLVVISLLGPAIVMTAVAAALVDRRAGLLLLPYLAWVAFATSLNYELWRLNR